MTTTRHWREALLPGELQQTPDGRRSARDWIVDGTMCLVAILVGALAIGDTWDQRSVTVKFLDIGLGVVALVALWWRRSHPGAVGAFTAGLTIISGAAAGPGLIAGFNVALRGTRNEILTVVGITAIAVSVYSRIYPNEESYLLNLFIGALVTAVVIGWGLFVRVRREQFIALRERAAQLEAEQQLHIEHARDAERRRIAREMHDVLAHRVSLLSLHAGALEFRRDASPEEIAEAAGVIRETARAALEDLRQVIGVLRDGSSEGEPPEPPQPTLADVPALVEESRAAGMRVSCHIVVDREVPPALGRTVYRIVQEGLTNARKHAPAAAVDVRIGGGEPQAGRAGAAAPRSEPSQQARSHASLSVAIVSRRPVGVAVAAAPLPGAGSGLIGLSERVALAGGELEHGPDAAGDFVLRATLPWTTA